MPIHHNRCCAVAIAAATTLLVISGCRSMTGSDEKKLINPLAAAAESQPLAAMPSERVLCIQTAETVAEKGHAIEAIKLYEKAERVSPDEPTLDRELAPLYAQTKAYDKAIDRYRRLLRADGADTETLNNLAWTLMEAGRLPEAAATAGQGLNLEPNDSRLTSTLAVIHYKQGDRKSALDRFTAINGPAAAHHNIALLDIDQGDEKSALRQLANAVQMPDCTPETREFFQSLRHVPASSRDGGVVAASLETEVPRRR